MSLDANTSRFADEHIAAAQRDGAVPALVAGVVRDGGLVHVSAAGELPEPHADQQSRIGSITKTFTAALVMALRDDGRLRLDDPLGAHLTDLAVGTPTIRQVLAHVSGLRREPPGPWWERSAGTDTATLIASVGPDALIHPPYRVSHYSNLGFGLLGAVVEKVAGAPWYEVLRGRLLAPLGLDRTTYHPTEPFLRGYVRHPYAGTLREEPRTDAGAMAPAGQLWSTVADLGRWAAFLADPDGSVLGPDTVEEMCAPVAVAEPDEWANGDGLGLGLARNGERVYAGHGGSMPGYQAILVVHRPSRTGVVGLANTYTLREGAMVDVGHDLLGGLLDRWPDHPTAAPWRPDPTPPPAHVAPLLGRWWWMGRGYDAIWDATAGELAIGDWAPGRFVATGPDTWRGTEGMNHGETLTVVRDAHGVPVALDIATFIHRREVWPDDV